MARIDCQTGYSTPGSVNQGARTVGWTFNQSHYHVNLWDPTQNIFCDHEFGIGVLNQNIGGPELSGPDNYSSGSTTLVCDKDYIWRGTAFHVDTTARGTIIGFRSYAVTATASAPTSSAITSSTATIACNFVPNTDASIATAKMQYRQLSSGTWLDAPGGSTDYSGYSQQSISRNLTGLLGGITYQFKLVMTRTTANETSFESSISNFMTLPDAPTITTNQASSVAAHSMTLNGTVNPNGVAGVQVRFGWGTSDGGPTSAGWANKTPYQNFSGSGDQAFSAGL